MNKRYYADYQRKELRGPVKMELSEKDRHGASKHRFYNRWCGMMERCYDKAHNRYQNYGGRGIIVSEEFKNSAVFLNYLDSLPGYGIDGKTTLDRIDNNGNYERGNLRWASRNTQQHNKRVSINNTSGVKGVYYVKQHGQWRAFLYINDKNIHIGYSKTIEGALKKRNSYIIKNNLPHKIQYLP